MYGYRPYYGYGRVYVDFMRVNGRPKVGAGVVAVAAWAYERALRRVEKMVSENEKLRVGKAVYGVGASVCV